LEACRAVKRGRGERGREREREKSTETDESFEMVFGRQAVDLERERVITEERWSDLGGCFDEERAERVNGSLEGEVRVEVEPRE
jgi:hypothetical protein